MGNAEDFYGTSDSDRVARAAEDLDTAIAEGVHAGVVRAVETLQEQGKLLTLRDYFAACAFRRSNAIMTPETAARAAYLEADALLAERAKKEGAS